MENPVLTGKAIWCFSYEIMQRNEAADIRFHVTGVKPFHQHESDIVLTESVLEFIGDGGIAIPLELITQLYIGFDEYYTRTLIRNFGLTSQPLRVSMNNGQIIYCFIDYGFFGTANKKWLDVLQQLLT